MRSSRLWWRLVVPAGLVVLVVTLGALQYHWLSQVSDAEHERRRTWLTHRAQELADEFDREIAAAYMHLQGASPALHRGDWAAFAERYQSWRDSARHPQAIRAVYLTDQEHPLDTLLEFDAAGRTFAAKPWPAPVMSLRQLVQPAAPIPVGRGGGTVELHQLLAGRDAPPTGVPAVIISLPMVQSVTVPWTANALTSLRSNLRYLILEIDRDYVRDVMFPELVGRFFPGRDVDEYRFALLDPSRPAAPLYTRGLARDATLDPARADATVSMFTLRFDLAPFVRRVAGSEGGAPAIMTFETTTGRPLERVESTQRDVVGTAPAPPPPPPPPMQVERGTVRSTTSNMSIVVQAGRSDMLKVTQRATTGPWRLVVQHVSGSLDAAVAQARRRNLWLSFGILAVLAAGVVLIVGNAQRSQRLAAQQMDFVATVSHELRTPLTVIRSAAQNLAAGVVSEPAQARRYGDLIETEGRRLTDMVEQVLEYAGLSGGRRLAMARPLDPGALVRDVVSSCAALFEAERFEVSVDVEDALPAIVADDGAIRRALHNLFTNAIKYGEGGRWLGVSARRVASGGRDEVQISVSDRGRGIDADDLGHIFEPFYRGRYALDRQIHGNGLGLSLVKRIAEAHGGRIDVKSAPGEGATFTLRLPAAPPEPEFDRIAEPAADAGGAAR
jgi:signal transduction histidine kinase